MQTFDRVQQLHQILCSHRHPVPISKLCEKMEASRKVVKSAIDTLRDYCAAPLYYSSEHKGWHYQAEEMEHFQLPGLWLTSNELLSLAALTTILEDLGKGVLEDELSTIKQAFDSLMNARAIDPKVVSQRIRVITSAKRQQSSYQFTAIADALIERKQIAIRYTNYEGRKTQRTISPQTLVHYRDNWYLDAWCHKRQALRTFSIPRINHLNLLSANAKSIPKKNLQTHFQESYGIFSGQSSNTVKLRFYGATARDIAAQSWHPNQVGTWEGNDYLLSLPYSDDRELLQDILRYVPDVLVEEPLKLREKLNLKLRDGLERQISTNED